MKRFGMALAATVGTAMLAVAAAEARYVIHHVCSVYQNSSVVSNLCADTGNGCEECVTIWSDGTIEVRVRGSIGSHLASLDPWNQPGSAGQILDRPRPVVGDGMDRGPSCRQEGLFRRLDRWARGSALLARPPASSSDPAAAPPAPTTAPR